MCFTSGSYVALYATRGGGLGAGGWECWQAVNPSRTRDTTAVALDAVVSLSRENMESL